LLAILPPACPDEQTPKDKKFAPEEAALREYLAQAHPKKKWQAGPTLLDSPELHKAYPGLRFVFVYSSPPLPPGANIREVQQAYRAQVKDIQENYVSLTASVMKKGDEWKVVPYTKAADFNRGLIKVSDDEEARVAAAAIASLLGANQVSPRPVSVKEVKVTKTDKGWTCEVQRSHSFQANVTINAKGEVTAVSKNYAGPFPP